MVDLTPALEQASNEKEIMEMLGYLMFGEKWKEIIDEHSEEQIQNANSIQG